MGILLVSRHGATVRKITNECDLTESQAEGFVSFLQQSDLLREEGAVFRPTRKGTSLIEDYEHIHERIEGPLVAH
jgi:predicted transcriptional regulator